MDQSKLFGRAIFAWLIAATICMCADFATCGEIVKVNTNDFDYCAQIVFKGYEGVELTDFPALVRVGPNAISGFRYSDCARNGGDITFADAEGNSLAYDMDEWNAETGEDSIFWVKVPKLSPQTKITVYWSSVSEIGRSDAAVVWAGCYGVWHLGEKSVAGGVTPCANSSANGVALAAVPGGANSGEDSVHVAGAAGRGRTATKNMGQAHDGRKSFLSIRSNDLATSLGNTFSVSGWFFERGVRTADEFPGRMISCKTAYTGSNAGWEFAALKGSVTGIDAFGKNQTSYGTTECPDGFDLTNGWMHVMVVYLGSQVRIYLNGELVSVELRNKMEPATSGSFGPATNDARTWYFGAMAAGGGGNVFVGDMDEIRVAYINGDNPEVSSERVKADYDTVTAADFAAYSAAKRVRELQKFERGKDYGYCADITFKGYAEETLVDFPALVKVGPEAIKGFRYAKCAADGSDIVFVDDKGYVLPCDLDEWRAASNEDSIFWVRIPELSPSTKISVYWGRKSAETLGRDAELMWGKAAGVWHCSEASGTCRNSTVVGSAMDALPTGANANTDSVAKEGMIGAARQLLDCEYPYPQDTTKARKSCLSVPKYDDLRIGGRFIWSGWFRAMGSHSGQPARLVSRKRAVSGSNAGWEICLEGGETTAIRIYGKSASNSALVQSCAEAPFDLVDWTNIAVAFDETALIVYVNGVQAYATTSDFAGATDSGYDLWVGGMNISGTGHAYGFVGNVDEFRLEPLFDKPIRSSTWMRASYETVAAGDFATYSEARPIRGLIILFR